MRLRGVELLACLLYHTPSMEHVVSCASEIIRCDISCRFAASRVSPTRRTQVDLPPAGQARHACGMRLKNREIIVVFLYQHAVRLLRLQQYHVTTSIAAASLAAAALAATALAATASHAAGVRRVSSGAGPADRGHSDLAEPPAARFRLLQQCVWTDDRRQYRQCRRQLLRPHCARPRQVLRHLLGQLQRPGVHLQHRLRQHRGRELHRIHGDAD